jgi:uncharacterized delta-60 repeat protein
LPKNARFFGFLFFSLDVHSQKANIQVALTNVASKERMRANVADLRRLAKLLSWQSALLSSLVCLSAQGLRDNSFDTVRFQESAAHSLFHVANSAYRVPETNGTLTVEIVRAGKTDSSSDVGYRLIPGAAKSNQDYIENQARLHFAPGELLKTVEIGIINDEFGAENNETFTLAVEDPSDNAEIFDPMLATITIDDDDFIDKTFNPGFEKEGVRQCLVQPDGKILITGSFTNVQGLSRRGFARLNPDGSLDTSFDPDTRMDYFIGSLVGLVDGKIIATGNFKNKAGVDRSGIARINSDGELDLSFFYHPETQGYQVNITATSVQPDGKVLVGGQITTTWYHLLIRLNTDGTVDTNFNAMLSFDDEPQETAKTIGLQSDGRILIGKSVIYGNPALVRLFPDGGKDATFVSPLYGYPINHIVVRSDGRILAARDANSGEPDLLRLNTDGSIDSTFHSPIFSEFVFSDARIKRIQALAIAPDQTIIVGGIFPAVDGYPRTGLVRLSPDGRVDAGFRPPALEGSWLVPSVDTVAVQLGNKVLVGGDISIPASQPPRTGLMRFSLAATLDIEPKIESIISSPNGVPKIIGRLETWHPLILEVSPDLVRWTAIYTNPVPSTPLIFSDESASGAAKRFYRLKAQP